MFLFRKIFTTYSELILSLITLLIYFILRKKIGREQKLLLIYLLISTAFLIPITYLSTLRQNNLFLYHWMALVETTALVFLIEQKVYDNGKLKTILIGGYTVFWIINVSFFESFNVFNSFSLSIESLIISFCCFRYMLSLTRKDEIMHFQKLPTFWIISGFLIYHVCCFLIFLVYKYQTIVYTGNHYDIWSIVLIINLIKFVFISIGLLWYQRSHSQY